MREAFDVIYNKTIDAEKSGLKYSITASSQRFICPYCDEFVFFSAQNIKVAHFGHSHTGTDCELRAQNESTGSRYYNPDNSFGLPIYLVGNTHKSLKIGFLQRGAGTVILKDAASKGTYQLTFKLEKGTKNHFVYLGLTRFSKTYYIKYSNTPNKIYHGEGLGDFNIFSEKTRRRIRSVEDKEKIIFDNEYILMIKKNSDSYAALKDYLEKDEYFHDKENFEFDQTNYELYYFTVKSKNEELKSLIKNVFGMQTAAAPLDVQFLWPLNYSMYDNKYLIYDDDVLLRMKNVELLKFSNHSKPIKQNNDEYYSGKITNGSFMIAWNEISGLMYQMSTSKKLDYISFNQDIHFYNLRTNEIIEPSDIIKENEVGIYSNVKIKMIAIYDRTIIKNLNNDDCLDIKESFKTKDLKAIYIMRNNKVVLKYESMSIAASTAKIIDYKKALQLASYSDNQISIDKEIVSNLHNIKNKQLKICIINSISKGSINEKLQNYLMEVLS